MRVDVAFKECWTELIRALRNKGLVSSREPTDGGPECISRVGKVLNGPNCRYQCAEVHKIPKWRDALKGRTLGA